MDPFVIKSKDKLSIKDDGRYGRLQTFLNFIQTMLFSKPWFSSFISWEIFAGFVSLQCCAACSKRWALLQNEWTDQTQFFQQGIS